MTNAGDISILKSSLFGVMMLRCCWQATRRVPRLLTAYREHYHFLESVRSGGSGLETLTRYYELFPAS